MNREHWGSQLAFVLAAAGSAVGLGNIWKFPYLVGQNGGGAFLLLYVACLALVGLPLMLVEILIGRAGQSDVVGSFRALAPGRRWHYIGFAGLAAGFLILSYYSVIAGWSLEFFYQTAAGSYWYDGMDDASRVAAVKGIFGKFVSDYHRPLMWHIVFMALCVGVVAGGVRDGIEFWSKILMPLLFGLVLLLIARVFFLDGSGKGYSFLFSVDWSKVLQPKVVLEAMGQAFFSLSLGMGAMVTYGSYLDRRRSLPRAATMVVLADTAVAVMAGLAIFPAVFAFGLDPQSGPGLVFSTLPLVFTKMYGGKLFGTLFFASLVIAALTSAISLLEVTVAYFTDEFGWSRLKTTVGVAAVIALLGVPTALSFAPSGPDCPLGLAESKVTILGKSRTFFDLVDMLASNILLPVGGLAMCIFVGWFLGRERALEEASVGAPWFHGHFLGRAWFFLVRWVAPVIVLLVFFYSVQIIAFDGGRMVLFKGWW